MDDILQLTLLYDFYGELLTEHQRSIYEDVVYNDMSLSEIAEENGISRQGVHDLIKRPLPDGDWRGIIHQPAGCPRSAEADGENPSGL